ncbi:hypothetical protein CHS0354_036741 [Potamilus streckersoni]|uniref:Uncharacterized protein n=1 Tax=Potamilus streckersoni TaxID=2493646 RepID=A0AAE0TDJ2_9BIVA|nr:hypothetical protein CHS0354_036741 [Potamilus streckersoni]
MNHSTPADGAREGSSVKTSDAMLCLAAGHCLFSITTITTVLYQPSVEKAMPFMTVNLASLRVFIVCLMPKLQKDYKEYEMEKSRTSGRTTGRDCLTRITERPNLNYPQYGDWRNNIKVHRGPLGIDRNKPSEK